MRGSAAGRALPSSMHLQSLSFPLASAPPLSAAASAEGFGPAQRVTSAVVNPDGMYAAELNGDGELEVLSASSGDDKIAWYENVSLGAFGPQQLVADGADGAARALTADLNGDGRVDVLAASQDDDLVRWFDDRLTPPDCNGRGAPDLEDPLAGTSADGNGNTFPDECEVHSGAAGDCDGEGVLDRFEIAAGAADGNVDGNVDGRPDGCDTTADSTLDLDGDGVVDRCEAVGMTGCAPAAPNSTNRPGVMTALGSAAIARGDLERTARQLPPSTFGYFIVSSPAAALTPIPNGLGTLCGTGSVGRGVGGAVLNSGPWGVFKGIVGLMSMPQPRGPVQVQAGDTWHFQAWHRDRLLGTLTTSNGTDAVSVTFL